MEDKKPDVDVRILIHDTTNPEQDTSDVYEIHGDARALLSTFSIILYKCMAHFNMTVDEMIDLLSSNFKNHANMKEPSDEA